MNGERGSTLVFCAYLEEFHGNLTFREFYQLRREPGITNHKIFLSSIKILLYRSVILSFGGSLIALALCVPALMFGVVGLATDWSMTSYNSCQPSLDQSEAKFVLPLCLKYLTPSLVSWIGVGVISAAVMSSADSSLLSSSSLIARNIWSKLIRPGCGEKEILRVLWCFTFINCGLATLLALQYKSVYEL